MFLTAMLITKSLKLAYEYAICMFLLMYFQHLYYKLRMPICYFWKYLLKKNIQRVSQNALKCLLGSVIGPEQPGRPQTAQNGQNSSERTYKNLNGPEKPEQPQTALNSPQRPLTVLTSLKQLSMALKS